MRRDALAFAVFLDYISAVIRGKHRESLDYDAADTAVSAIEGVCEPTG